MLLFLSLSFAFYPSLSKEINMLLDDKSIVSYIENSDSIQEKNKNDMLETARKYNEWLCSAKNTAQEDFSYYEILNVTDKGEIGVVSIPKISVSLPVYHESKEYLDKGAIHMKGSAFPIGGQSTHSVISAHTAFPGRVFFDDLTQLVIGDDVFVDVLGNVIRYKVSEINIVLPTDTQKLEIVKGEDRLTLVTCTPYAVNTHRLLVTCKRAMLDTGKNSEPSYDTPQVKRSFVFIFLYPLSITVLIVSFVIIMRRKRNEKKE